ncbi:MAG: polyphosphate--glucose phosphotransferase [Saprospiraceae bacterium]
MIEDQILGIDVGASGIKGAIVNVKTGELVTERFRVPTPFPSKPKAVAKSISEVVNHFDWKGLIGVGFPAIIQNGVAKTAANIDKKWIGTNVEELLSEATGCPVYVRNDADVAGIAELQFGAGKGAKGTVILITIGSGLGSAVFTNGVLLPNSELGHLKFKGMIAEHYAADSIRKRLELSWGDWGKRFNEYLQHLELLFSPDLILLGGGSSKKFDKYKNLLKVESPVVPAQLLNHAGIIGAAFLASSQKEKTLTS